MVETERWSGFLLLVVAAAAWAGSRSFSYLGGIFCWVAAGTVAFFGLGLVGKGSLRPRRVPLSETPGGTWGVATLAAGAIAYVWLIPRLGFLPASILFYGVTTWMLGRDRNAREGALSLGAAMLVAGVFYAAFRYGFEVPLPEGAWWAGMGP